MILMSCLMADSMILVVWKIGFRVMRIYLIWK
jgi:hypothetical protein